MIAVRSALLAALVLLAPCSTHASIMNFDANFDSLKMEILSEGPMFTTLESPYRQTGKKSEISRRAELVPGIASGRRAHGRGGVHVERVGDGPRRGCRSAVLQCEADHTTSVVRRALLPHGGERAGRRTR